MKQLSLRNCLVSLMSVSCLGIVAAIIGGVILFQNIYKDPVNVSKEIPNEHSHLQAKSKPIESVIGIVSDSETDWETLSQAVENLENGKISNAFHAGDITQLGVIEDLKEAKRITDNSSINWNFIPGDRDLWKSSGTDNFKAVMGQDYKLVIIGSYKFLLIDNANEYEGIDDTEWKFIEQNIYNADFVILHNPIYFSDSVLGLTHHGMGQYSDAVEAQRLRLLSLIRKSNVKAVFAGDQHLFSETDDDEKPELNHYVVGALNAARNIQQPNYLLLTLYTDGDYHVEQVYLMPSE
jgi:hypothetical protein